MLKKVEENLSVLSPTHQEKSSSMMRPNLCIGGDSESGNIPWHPIKERYDAEESSRVGLFFQAFELKETLSKIFVTKV